MTAECRPPDGTPDGTVCFLKVLADIDGQIVEATVRVLWKNMRWNNQYGDHVDLPDGFRFHSIAQTPEDAK